jgi:hypothetical protein
MKFTIAPSPSPDVFLSLYDTAADLKFHPVFETPPADSPMSHLTRLPEEATFAVVLENRSEKAITGLRYRWSASKRDGKPKTLTVSSDSYLADVYRAVVEPGARQIISPSGSLSESMLDHVQRGGGFIEGRVETKTSLVADASELTFAIDLIVFADGEIAGPDPDSYAADLQCRKPAAEFVAKQVRKAEAESRDVTPVLSALAEIPHLRNDPLAHWTQHYARDYLRHSQQSFSGVDRRNMALRHLENRPDLPRFYRRTTTPED